MDSLLTMTALIEEASLDADKFYIQNNKAAGTRLRRAMQEIKKLAQKVRQDVQHHKKRL